MVDNVQQIKDKLDIIDVISGYLKLTKSGINYKARCPFHNEKTPSFFVTPERQIWHCFGCSKGGDMFGFIQDIEGVEFRESLQILAQKAGIKLEFRQSADSDFATKDDKAVLYEICETSARFFEKQLNNSNAGKRAMEYLKNRGLTDETMKDFRLGFAPSPAVAGWDSLSRFLRDCGYKDNDIIDAGLAIKREGANSVYDRFRSRIVFPISDLNGQVVGFTGRVFSAEGGPASGGEESAKYINTPQTAIYDKSRILYGLDKAKTEIRREDKCVMVEGNMDALMSYQSGVKNVIATSGTALTQSHLKIIQRYTPNLGFCFDTDQAGAMATRRGIGLALANGLNVKVVEIQDPECKDPADYVKKYGTGWADAVSKAKPVLEFYFDKAKIGFNPNSADSKKIVISILAPFIKRLTSRVERSHWVSQLAFLLRAKEEAVEADLASAKDDLPGELFIQTAVASEELPKSEKEDDILSQALLSVIMKNPILFKEELNNIQPDLLDSYTANAITCFLSGDSGDIAETMKEFRKKEQSYKLEFAYLRSQELWKDFSEKDLKVEFHNLINKIKKRSINAQLSGLVYDIKEAETNKDKEKITELANKFNQLTKELTKIQQI
ncbi:MAG: DNA primase [Candidatus Colwellbacteria bacterium]